MLSIYPACFFKEEEGYSVVFPDLNWLSTCGESLEEAMAMAVDCIAGYLYSAKMSNEGVCKASAITDIKIEEIAKEIGCSTDGAFVNMVSVDVSAYAKEHFEKSVKKTLSIPAWLNKLALEQNINFSQVLQEALIAKVGNSTRG
ncbi:MAG: type II toxin-antitoxin system HicB family antitoxin [Lachnospiraceae bacterium]|nr:type II toxin-antitoxin system HicB family antitoxin [Lachnospiraceae bacterium]